MFGKSKKTKLNIVNCELVPVNFETRNDRSASYVPPAYREYVGFSEKVMIPWIEKELEKIFAGEFDEGNSNLLIGRVRGRLRKAIGDLDLQRNKHRPLIARLDMKDASDMEDVILIRNDKKKVLDEIEKELDELKKKQKANTARSSENHPATERKEKDHE